MSTHFYEEIDWKVVDGPNRDRLFDCMKYARDNGVKLWVYFALEGTPVVKPGVTYVEALTVRIDSLQHASVDGCTFAIDSSYTDGSGRNLKIEQYNTINQTGQGVKLYE